MRRTTEAIERDLAALIKHSNDLRREAEELNRTAEESAKKAARWPRKSGRRSPPPAGARDGLR